MNISRLYLLFSLLIAWESLAPRLAHGVTTVKNELHLAADSINQHLYPGLIRQKKEHLGWMNDSQTNCGQKLRQFLSELDNDRRAAYFDSFGKIGAGILTGNTRYLGYYDQCIDISNTEYCRFPFDATLTTSMEMSVTRSVNLPLQFGMCFPSSCSAKDFYHLFFNNSDEVFYSTSFTDAHATIYTINVSISTIHKEPVCPLRDLKWTTSSIITLTVCILFVVLVITGTMIDVLVWFIYDILPKKSFSNLKPSATVTDSTSCEVRNSVNEDERPKPKLIVKKSVAKTSRCIAFLKDLILSFSLYKTIPAIMETHQPTNAITSINGIRVISMFWVILGHTFMWELDYGVITNIKEFLETTPVRFSFQPISNPFFSVDNFFVLSGLLLSYLSIREINRCKGKFPFVVFYVHRLLRLSPAYYFLVFFNFKVLPYVGSGPLWLLPDIGHCEKYWWTNILYINNFYPAKFADQCYYSVTWYLANDMQFFIISPIFLLLLYHFWKIGIITIFGTMLTSIALTGTLAGIRNLNANLIAENLAHNGEAPLLSDVAFTHIYQKPYCRINAYLIGIVLGFVFYRNWRITCNFWIRLCIYIVLWIIAVACCFTTIFGQYWTWHGHPFSKAENVMYFMLSRIVYSIGIAFMIYACHNGFGGVINTFLSWSIWVPLSRLTFMAYLSHPIVLNIMYNTLRFRFIYTDYILIILVTAAIVLSYSLALVFAVFVEFPLANVESAVYKFAGMKRRK